MSLELFVPEGERLVNLETSKVDELAAGLEKALEEYDRRPVRLELVFSFREVTGADREAVGKRLRELAGAEIAEREAAEKALEEMGGPALVVLRGVDRGLLDPDAAARAQRIVEALERRDAGAHRDVAFLATVKDGRGRERLKRILAALKPPAELLEAWWAEKRDLARWNEVADRYEWK
jgi:hypothetical protein